MSWRRIMGHSTDAAWRDTDPVEMAAQSTAAGAGAAPDPDHKGLDGLDGLDANGTAALQAASTDDAGQTSAPVYRVYKRRWLGLVQLTLLNIIVSWDWLTYSPVASQSASFFRTTESAINWLSTAFLFAFVVVTPAAIWVLHRGPRPAVLVAAVLLLLGNWIRYAGTAAGRRPGGAEGGYFGVVMFGQILTGLAQPFVLAAPARYSDLWFTHRGRVAATALMSLANPFGAALGQLIVPFWVGTPNDLPDMVLYVSVMSSAICLLSFFVLSAPPTPVAPSSETPKQDLLASARLLARSPEFWLLFLPYAVYVGFFNSVSTLLNQFFVPYGYSDTDAGIGGGLLIIVGLVAAAISSPILDRTKAFLLVVKICIPLMALFYLVLIWMPQTHDSGGLAGPYVVLSLLGASSFVVVPVAIELLVEMSHPVSPEVTSTLAWSGGQLLGGIFILISDALRDGPDAHPPFRMKRALIFTAVVALAFVPLPLALGCFGRAEFVRLRRVQADARARRDAEAEAQGGA